VVKKIRDAAFGGKVKDADRPDREHRVRALLRMFSRLYFADTEKMGWPALGSELISTALNFGKNKCPGSSYLWKKSSLREEAARTRASV